MNLIEEAVIIEIFGIRVYAFGVYVMLGAACAVLVLAVLGKAQGLKKGTVPLTAVLSMAFGLLLSRLVFCLLNQELGKLTPLSVWAQVAGGGYSMFGLLGGVFLGGLLSAVLTKEKTGTILDILSCAVLPMIAAERIGENRIEDFDISRPLDTPFLARSFLAVSEDEPCLATYYVAAAVALVLFVFLVFRKSHSGREGNLAITFMLFFGASAIVTESLRYDRFLSISFVGLQQVLAALTLGAGVVLAVIRSGRLKSALAITALVCLPLMVGIVLGLEFALDRTTWNKILIYAGMIITVMVTAVLGLKLLNGPGKGKPVR